MSSVGKHAQPVSGFSPLNFGGCSLWLDATATSNFALTGSNVTAWYDKSPLSNHATSVSGGSPVLSNTAINGRPGVYFSNAPSIGGPLALSNTGVAGFILARPLQTGLGRNSDQRIFSAADTGQGDYNSTLRFLIGVQQQQAEIRMYRGGGIIPAGRMNASNTYIISWNYDGTTHSFFLNGVPGEITPTVVSGGLPFSSSRYQLGNQVILTTEVYNGMIGEVIIYNDALAPAQRQAVEGYLAWKWGIAPALGTTFSPLTSLPSCAVWFDGADRTSFTLSGSNITQWRDKAGSNVTSNIGTPVYVSNAVNGVPGVQLDVNSGFKISPMSNAANTTTMSIYGLVTTGSGAQNNARLFTVGRISDGGTNNDYSSSSLWTLFRVGDGTLRFQHAGGLLDGGTVLGTVGNPCLMSVVFTGTTASLWANGYSAGSINTTNTLIFDRIGIGKNTNPDYGSAVDSFVGTIGEFLIFYAAHTEAQRLQVESYLASKWNIPMRAPPHLIPTHPYTRTRPFLRDFFPTDAPGCALWLDAGDRSTLTLSSSNTVTGWADKSGNRRPLTVNSAGTYSATGFNGRPTIQFTNGQYMTTSTAAVLTNSFTVFLVHQITGTGQANWVFTAGSADSNIYSLFRTDFNTYQIGQANGGSTGNWHYNVQTNPLVESITIRPVAPYWNQYLNGVRSVNPNIGGSTAAPLSTVGNSNVFIPGPVASGSYIGNISEVLIFSNALSSPQRQLVENYLATKWGHRGYMQGPLAHPFRYGPATGVTLESAPLGCSLWLDAADASTLTLSGSNVTAWRDKIGQTTLTLTGTPPTYVSNQVRFNSSGRFQGAYTMTTQTTMFLVYSTTNTTTNARLVTMNGNEYGNIHVPVGANNDIFLYDGGSTGLFASVTPQTGRRMYTVAFNGTSTALWRNGSAVTLTGTPGAGPPTGTTLTIGAYTTGGEPWSGDLAELIFFDTVLTTAQRQQMEGYLSWKWGIPFRLPGGSGNTAALYKSLTVDFDPRSIGSCGTWFDAADPTTVQFASGSNIARWLDKSGLQNHLATNSSNQGSWPTYTSNTLNGKPVVTFSNAGMLGLYAPTSPTQPQTMFVVARPTGLTGNQVLVQCPTLYDQPAGYLGMSVVLPSWTSYTWMYSAFYGENNGVSNALTASTTRTDIIAGSWKPNSMTIAVNGTEYGFSSVTPGALGTKALTNSKMVVGGGWYYPENYYRDFYNGYIAEILIFSNFVSSADRQRIEGYLASKWGLQSQLPALHPYSNASY